MKKRIFAGVLALLMVCGMLSGCAARETERCDVLASTAPVRAMTAALLACGLPAFEAAACAVYLHGAAADRAAAKRGEYGMLPHDILPELGALFAENQR